jgi:cell division septum initiation protein DivIVA
VVRNEANANGDRLIKKAKDPISKRLAEEAARKLREEGENSARKIIDEANVKADGVIKTAREQGDKLLAP